MSKIVINPGVYSFIKSEPKSPTDLLLELRDQWNNFEFRPYDERTKHEAQVLRNHFKHIMETFPELHYKMKDNFNRNGILTTLDDYGFKTFSGIGSMI